MKGPSHRAEATRLRVWTMPTSPTILRLPREKGASPLPVMPLQGGWEPLWLLLALGPGHPHNAYQRTLSLSLFHIHTQLTHAHRCIHVQNSHRVCMCTHSSHRVHTCAHLKLTAYMSVCMPIKNSHWFACAHAHRTHRMCVHACTYIACTEGTV